MFAPDAPGELGDLPNPDMLRRPTMRREAQSTSALEGTFEPLETVLAQDYEVGEDKSGLSESMREVLNYLDAAECGIGQIQSGHPISLHSRARIAEASCEGHEVRQSTGLGYTIHPSVHRLTHAAHRGCAFRAHASGANRAVAGAVADDEPRPAEPAAAVRADGDVPHRAAHRHGEYVEEKVRQEPVGRTARAVSSGVRGYTPCVSGRKGQPVYRSGHP